jgi:pimeloyl-ACP methyl ester carboxylesterase
MPVLALGAEHSMGETVADLARKVATDVTGGVVEGSGHWIAEERPADLIDRLVNFLP